MSPQRRLPAALAAGCLLAGAALLPVPAGAVGRQDDPGLRQQWSLRTIRAAEAWAGATGAGVKIGVVDTGIDLAHEDLGAKVVAHIDCVGSAGNPAACAGPAQDDNGHGSHVAGTAAAITGNGRGVAGVAPDAQLVVAKALSGEGGGTITDVNAGIRWVVDHGAQVVNLSLGDPNFFLTAVLGSSLRDGIEYAWAQGAVPVLASGNSNQLGLGLGGSEYGDINAIVVGATGRDDTVADYSSPLGTAKWAVVAPGGSGNGTPAADILSTYWVKDHPNAYAEAAGTSMAAPHVAGVVALLLGKGLTPRQAVEVVLATADKTVDCGELLSNCAGRVDAAAAVSAQPPADEPADTPQPVGAPLFPPFPNPSGATSAQQAAPARVAPPVSPPTAAPAPGAARPAPSESALPALASPLPPLRLGGPIAALAQGAALGAFQGLRIAGS